MPPASRRRTASSAWSCARVNPVGERHIIRVRLFNAKFSPNLGDGLSCECLEKALIEHGCDPMRTYSVDVAARSSYEPGSGFRGSLLRTLETTPAVLRRNLLRLPLAVGLHGKWLPHYRRHLDDADAVVIGGGNLFSDLDLNFPTKLAAVIEEAALRRLPVSVYGVGVGAAWSEAGSRLIGDALRRARVTYVSVRDRASKEHFDDRFSEAAGRTAEVVRDPGLLIARYVAPAESGESPPPVGVGITSAIAVRYHSTRPIGDERLLRWYAETVEALGAAGRPIRIFTNGSPEDVEFAEELLPRLAADVRPPVAALRPTDPSDLARTVSSCSVVIAFRLHALIAAYSYGAGIVALRWDDKLEAFLESVGLEGALASPPETSPQAIVDLTDRLSAGRASVPGRAEVVDEAMRDVGKLASALRDGRG